ncbi:TMAO reductase system periplasmic protein TorT [Pseudodesulfovibrio indicus]|uniref:TMAO reductase system periplasmic protein TorT n=1 Tax=Pseudodesulfovibrio indicus TaxID=1716143 RepID=UPI00292F56AE|nr:TMAO reductase system periplasmic protein TorT [Pseudodesulfovibrio indicus]
MATTSRDRFCGKTATFLAGCVLLVLAVLLGASSVSAQSDVPPWWPIQVKSYYGVYAPSQKKPGQAATSLSRPRLEEWMPPLAPAGRYTLGVCVPHLKDPYWIAATYGIIDEAKRLGVGIRLMEAGSYHGMQRQIDHLRHHLAEGVDGIILSAISYAGEDDIISEIRAREVPVVELINDVNAPDISAKALVSFYEMGYLTGEYVAEHAEKAGLDEVRVAFFPGPQGSGWSPETLDGFIEALELFPGRVTMAAVAWGDTGKEEQLDLLRRSLAETGPVDYLVGNAVAAEVAPDLLRELGMEDRTTVIATYIMPSLYDLIRSGAVQAAPSDLTVFQGRMAVDMMVRLLKGEKAGRDFPFRSGPFIPMVTTSNIASYPFEGLFGPRDFKPVFELEPRE